MGVKNDITADKSITTKLNRRHKAALAEGEGFEPPDTFQSIVRFQVFEPICYSLTYNLLKCVIFAKNPT